MFNGFRGKKIGVNGTNPAGKNICVTRADSAEGLCLWDKTPAKRRMAAFTNPPSHLSKSTLRKVLARAALLLLQKMCEFSPDSIGLLI